MTDDLTAHCRAVLFEACRKATWGDGVNVDDAAACMAKVLVELRTE